MKNNIMQSLIVSLEQLSKKQDVAVWKRIAKDLSKPTRSRRSVNVSKLAEVAKDSETIIVPGKILGNGTITTKVDVVAYQISDAAAAKIKEAKGTYRSLEEEMKKNPKGSKLRIVG
jgi:large subunit ribosomal protein L18e